MNNFWIKILKIKPYYLFILFVVAVTICIASLRENNQHMSLLRDKVFIADRTGNGLTSSLYELRSYVNSHMNTSLSSGNTSIYPPIQLQHTYERLVIEQTNQEKNNIYYNAQVYCQQLNSISISGKNRIPCIQEYIANHGQQSIPTGLFEFNFQSPSWSPDLAGWSLIVSGFLIILFFLDLFYWIINKKITDNNRLKNKNI